MKRQRLVPLSLSMAAVLKEEKNFDFTLPLHDATGKIIGAVGWTVPPQPCEQETAVARRARETAQELERQISSMDELLVQLM